MLGWLAKLGLRRDVDQDEPRLLEAIKRAIDLVEPRLEHVSGYPNRYRDMAKRMLRHAEALAAGLPGPVELNRERFVLDPFVRALFASPDDIPRTLSLSRAMREYRQCAGVPEGELYALMGMRYRQKHVFGMEARGEVIRRDVEQEALSFEDHTLSCISVSEAETRALLIWDVFDHLMRQVARRLELLRQERQSLAQAKDRIMAQLRGASADRRAGMQLELDALLSQQRELLARLDLHHVASLFDDELRTPEAHVRLEQRKIQLDGMGVLRRPEESVLSHAIDFTDLVGMDRRRWTVVLVRYRHQELSSMSDRMENARRWLYA
ncbi:MAG: hypothetical protein B7Y41_13840 [Hydrogenophilales bacterium 28-61-23]|nr:MAG: hypothetical protein B7Y41_13840 [Hydrogenophilales bacterium 28-61-23]